jgi:hypothetical protein
VAVGDGNSASNSILYSRDGSNWSNTYKGGFSNKFKTGYYVTNISYIDNISSIIQSTITIQSTIVISNQNISMSDLYNLILQWKANGSHL